MKVSGANYAAMKLCGNGSDLFSDSGGWEGLGMKEGKWLSLALRFKKMRKKWSLDFHPLIKLSYPQLVTKFLGLAFSLPFTPQLNLLSVLFPFKAALNIKKQKTKKTELQTLFRSNPGSHIAFHFPCLLFSNLCQFLFISLSFITLTLLKSSCLLFCRLSLNWDLPDVFSWLGWGFEVSARNLHSSDVSFSVYHIGVHAASMFLYWW